MAVAASLLPRRMGIHFSLGVLGIDDLRSGVLDCLCALLHRLAFIGFLGRHSLSACNPLSLQRIPCDCGGMRLPVWGSRFDGGNHPVAANMKCGDKVGIHDVHMNQGNPPPHEVDVGILSFCQFVPSLMSTVHFEVSKAS